MTMTVLSLSAVVGCSVDVDTANDESPSSTVTSDATPSAIPDSYRYVIESSCGERGFLGRYRVVVRDGAVVSVKNLNDDYPYQPDFAEVPTLEIDHVPNAIDDEECYEVSALKIIDTVGRAE